MKGTTMRIRIMMTCMAAMAASVFGKAGDAGRDGAASGGAPRFGVYAVSYGDNGSVPGYVYQPSAADLAFYDYSMFQAANPGLARISGG